MILAFKKPIVPLLLVMALGACTAPNSPPQTGLNTKVHLHVYLQVAGGGSGPIRLDQLDILDQQQGLWLPVLEKSRQWPAQAGQQHYIASAELPPGGYSQLRLQTPQQTQRLALNLSRLQAGQSQCLFLWARSQPQKAGYAWHVQTQTSQHTGDQLGILARQQQEVYLLRPDSLQMQAALGLDIPWHYWTLGPDATSIWGLTSQGLEQRETGSWRLLDRFPLPRLQHPGQLCLAAGLGQLLISDPRGGQLLSLDPLNNQQRSLAVGYAPEILTLAGTPQQPLLAVASGYNHTLYSIDPATWHIHSQKTTGFAVVDMAATAQRLWVGLEATAEIQRYALPSLSLQERTSLSAPATDLLYAGDTLLAALSNRQLVWLHPQSLTPLGHITLPAVCSQLGYSAQKQKLYAVFQNSAQVMRIDLLSRHVSGVRQLPSPGSNVILIEQGAL